SVYAIATAISTPKPTKQAILMAAFWDNEEIGSETAQGAGSPFLSHILERINLSLDRNREEYLCMLNRSLCVSVDLAHALHPNYSNRHEPQHPILMQHGIVIKYNAQHRY